ncbi:aminotransferase, class V [Parvularcula bermudensis HTCC2503]|uniref:Cysteine desulfurase n=1 Tax=Parvularcula bermudensis (strain ATCC BAA-594 / HTCC2503 / KCTC 12087) TaxID=314260 RepID=E0TEF1_PARBH|nr:SufS family cysteine desulfurase [Parvularcula bermudensis]ADM10037.1 aminotransferase, class V [Parvularcula bermudensis HTCC2503]
MTDFDVDRFRQQFPILSRDIGKSPLAYLDNAASVQKPQAVIDAMATAMATSYANVHRGLHTLANETTAAFEEARTIAANYLGAASQDEIVFCSGGTDAINLVANSLGQDHIGEGDEIILSVMEHHSNIVPWHFLRERKGVVLKWLDVDENGHIDIEAYKANLSPRTKLVAITGQSNVLGAFPDVRTMADLAHDVGALLLVDGCQHAVHGPVDVQALNCDFYVLTGHKTYGPTGIGVLYGRQSVLEGMPPFRGGGEMIDRVDLDGVTYNEPPHRFEAGTPPILEAIGLGAALSWVMEQDHEGLRSHERALTDHAMEALRSTNIVTLYGASPEKGPIVAFNLKGAHPHDVATLLDNKGVAVRAGHHCCQPLMARLGVTATARASFAPYNTHDEVDALVDACVKAHNLLN